MAMEAIGDIDVDGDVETDADVEMAGAAATGDISPAAPVAADTGSVRTRPRVVMSKIQASTQTGMKPTATAMINARCDHAGRPSGWNVTSAICSATQANTRYAAAVRNTRRRRSSAY